MTAVAEGMDVGRVRNVAAAMLSLASRTDDVRDAGNAQIKVLQGAWEGPDLEKFSEGWSATMPRVASAATAMRHAGQDLHRQADDQEKTSDGIGRSPVGPIGKQQPGFFERLWNGIKGLATTVVSGLKSAFDAVMDFIGRIPEWVITTIQTVKTIVSSAWKIFKSIKDILKPVTKALTGIAKVLAKFSKLLPGVGALAAIWDAKDVFVDLWNGEINPHEFWNKVVLGGGAAVAAFFPPWGTLISGVLTLEQLRHEWAPKFDQWVSDQTGIDPNIVKGARFLFQGPIATIGDLMPDENFDLPGPSPREVVGGAWDAAKEVAENFPLPSIPNPLPWP